MAKRKIKSATTSDVAAKVAAAAGVSKATVRAVLSQTSVAVASFVKGGYRVNLTGLGIYYLRNVKATKAGTRKAFGTTIKVKARPARKVPKIRVPKKFKDML